MALLPKPYPDEIIGSVVARACYQSGMPFKRMIQSIFGTTRSSASFLMSWDVSLFGRLAGLDAEEVLELHTMFPYSVAFMSAKEQYRLRDKALNPTVGVSCLGALTKNISHGVPFRRICLDCVAVELAKYGEAYWHRGHLLPGVLICPIHGSRLRITTIPVRGGAHDSSVALPNDIHAPADLRQHAPEILAFVKNLSLKTFNEKIMPPDCWPSIYRAMALEKGYGMVGGDLAGQWLSLDLQRFFGTSFLTETGCRFPPNQRNSWPSLMVRPGIGVPFATPKHILIQSFFSCAETANGNFEYLQPGPQTRDLRIVDEQTLVSVKATLLASAPAQTRFTVQRLLEQAGVWHTFRHDRSRFPLTNAFILTFRVSDRAERQIGGRRKGEI